MPRQLPSGWNLWHTQRVPSRVFSCELSISYTFSLEVSVSIGSAKLLDNKVAIITGAAKGQGATAAELFAEHGAKIVVADIDVKNGEGVAERINRKSGPGSAAFAAVDVTSATSVEELVAFAVRTYGGLDIMYNNAGVIVSDVLSCDMSEADWDKTMAVDVKGVWLGCKYAIPEIMKRGGGAIINTGSVWSQQAYNGSAAYCTAKAAVVALTKVLACEYGRYNVRVNSILPGAVETELLKQFIENSQDPAALRAGFASLHAMNRVAQPIEIAKAALFLASDLSSFVNSASLLVDGGRACWERPL